MKEAFDSDSDTTSGEFRLHPKLHVAVTSVIAVDKTAYVSTSRKAQGGSFLYHDRATGGTCGEPISALAYSLLLSYAKLNEAVSICTARDAKPEIVESCGQQGLDGVTVSQTMNGVSDCGLI